MNFHYSTHISNTIYRPQNYSSHFNEDAHCDNEVNLILEKNSNKQSKRKYSLTKQPSVLVNQTDRYYFMPIREQNSTTALAGHNVTDNSSLLLSDLQHSSTVNLFDDSNSNFLFLSTINMNSSDTPTDNKLNNNNDCYYLNDIDLTNIFLSSMVSNNHIDNNNETPSNAFDDIFTNNVNNLTRCSSTSINDKEKSIGPPPGFENFIFDSSTTSDLLVSQPTNNSTLSLIGLVANETPVSSSDTINFSQLFESTSLDKQQQQQQQPIGGNVGNIRSSSSSSSHSSLTSDEQSIFFPMSTHPYSSSSMVHATSQISFTNAPSASTITTTTNTINKPHIPNSLSLNKPNRFSSSSSLVSLVTSSTTNSPISLPSVATNDFEKKLNDGGLSTNQLFSSTNSFFTNGHTEFVSSKTLTNDFNTINPRTSSSASSSTSSSIDDALIQLTQQQQISNVKKLFNDEPISMFNYSSLPTKSNVIDQQKQAVHDNINFLALMSTGSTATSMSLDLNLNLQGQNRAIIHQQPNDLSQSKLNIHELMENLNELCYKGFDELNALIQEQRWVQNYVTTTSLSNSPSGKFNGSNCCTSRVLIVPEYFIFKCKKVELSATHVFELLSAGRAELRLNDLMFVFKSWKESILDAEIIHQEEENKFRLSTEHPQSFYMTDVVLQRTIDRVLYAIRQLCTTTQQARAAFQYATLNVFQTSSRQQQIQSQTSSTSINFAQFQQQKSSPNYRTNVSIRPIS